LPQILDPRTIKEIRSANRQPRYGRPAEKLKRIADNQTPDTDRPEQPEIVSEIPLIEGRCPLIERRRLQFNLSTPDIATGATGQAPVAPIHSPSP
jgi:hypothetical protein